MKDEKKVKATEEKGTPLTDEELAQVTGGKSQPVEVPKVPVEEKN